MSGLGNLLTATTSKGDVVGGEATGFATKAGFAAAVTAITGAVIAAVQEFADLKVDPAIKVAALGLVGIGALAWAIAATGDVLARAYATAHVVAAPGAEQKPVPVLQWAIERTSQAQVAAVLQDAANTAAAAGTHAPAAKSGEQSVAGLQFVGLPGAVKVNYQGSRVSAFALRLDSAKPDEVSVLVAGADDSPQWVDAAATTLAQ